MMEQWAQKTVSLHKRHSDGTEYGGVLTVEDVTECMCRGGAVKTEVKTKGREHREQVEKSWK